LRGIPPHASLISNIPSAARGEVTTFSWARPQDKAGQPDNSMGDCWPPHFHSGQAPPSQRQSWKTSSSACWDAGSERFQCVNHSPHLMDTILSLCLGVALVFYLFSGPKKPIPAAPVPPPKSSANMKKPNTAVSNASNMTLTGNNPCLIAVMGCTGAGKSSFIGLVTGASNVQVGHNLMSETSEVACHSFSHRGRTITLVDTPGFDDSDLSDRDILMKLLAWLKQRYDAGQKLSGILYLHRIDAPRMQGSALRNFGTFKQLCGEGFYRNVMLGTTCWDLLVGSDGERTGSQRESQLRDRGGFWHPMVAKGSEVRRIPRERDAARNLVLELAERAPSFVQSQSEMGQMGMRMDQVSAVKTIDVDLERLRAENERARREQQEAFERAQRAREQRARAEMERERKRQEEVLRREEEKRQKILQEQRELEARREREMRELEEQMRRARIREAEERERERLEGQKRLDRAQFGLDYKALCSAVGDGNFKTRVLSWLKVCGHCVRLMENESYVGELFFLFFSSVTDFCLALTPAALAPAEGS